MRRLILLPFSLSGKLRTRRRKRASPRKEANNLFDEIVQIRVSLEFRIASFSKGVVSYYLVGRHLKLGENLLKAEA